MSSPLRVSLAALAVAASLAAPAPCAEAGKKYALLVGVKEYDHASLPNLEFTENDVEALHAVLSAKGAGFAEVVVLTTTRGKKDAALRPTAKNIRAQLKRLSGKVNKADLLLVGLAGHGLQMVVTDPATKKEADEPFFCPCDARPKAKQKLEDARATMIPLRELFRELDDSGAGVRLVLVDACRDEPKLGRNAATDDLPKPAQGTAVLFSCKSGERAFETPKLGKGHGVFFHYVIEGLKGEAKKNKKGELSWNALADYVVEKVQDEVPTVIGGGATQTPHEMRNLVGKSPVLLGEAAVEVAAGARLFAEAEASYSGIGVQVDLPRAARLYREAAEKGHPVAGGLLGIRTYEGDAIEKDVEEGKRLAAKALPGVRAEAARGDAAAMRCLGDMYYDGIAVDKDEEQAARWHRKAADKGDASAMNSLGQMYRKGDGVAKDDEEAVRWYKKAADKGYAAAMYNVGRMYKEGRGVTKDHEEAIRWFRKSADKGDSWAMNGLGSMYKEGQGVAQDYAEAMRWFRKAADKGNDTGMIFLGRMYANGTGVKKDDEEAFRWYRKAADKGHAIGMSNLGHMYANGRGVEKDDVEAVRWYRKAADKGHAAGMDNLGVMYENGRGVKKDDEEAVRWYKKAADKGFPRAMFNMGVMTADGRGVPQDKAAAIAWFKKAAALGDEYAKKKLAELGE